MCIIVADGDGQNGRGIELLQSIESILYNKKQERAEIAIDLLVSSDRQVESSLTLVHRGYVTLRKTGSNLLQYAATRSSTYRTDSMTADEALYKIYEDRIAIDNSRDLPSIKFTKRADIVLLDKVPFPIGTYSQEHVAIEYAIRAGIDVFPPFTAISIKNIPQGVSWFRVCFGVDKHSYANLVSRNLHFWIDGGDRVQQQIESDDLPNRWYRLRKAEDFYLSRIKGHIIKPAYYDVIVFQPGISGVDEEIECQPVTAQVVESSIPDDVIRARARHFVTRSGSFWIDLCFKNDPRMRQPEPMEPDSVLVAELLSSGIIESENSLLRKPAGLVYANHR